ncbi:MAG: phosphoglucosamine mutase [Bacteroidetes bacterium GWF2_42_66]|nr:MAG: phosphoglucosamine mutase [Bacteroidetes bacterium GWA2_42_15]OFX97862.1 MAG: phosphoglucosamine mutase [Bacteroidetes bacterium GWE2_42_39]OFY44161.1 MAG: phosphoglucosamine mutase [Bacteroidetes bacterium GWF2_42_66]HBL74591.1 phosphoglucosamine mutase [Prolixibacteraceae bacterium]HCU60901.1 phosphoglucosamine mutase [Prolixibacteraceae bacterium]
MTLIKSISGIRGTIGGKPGEGLSPLDVVKFTSAYAVFIKAKANKQNPKIVVGRDARISGEMVKSLVIGSLTGMGCNVVDIDLATTPTTEIAVPKENADGGIILTASHNPKQWNALKLLDANGEFLSAAAGAEILQIAESESFVFAEVDQLGKVENKNYTDIHIQDVLNLELVDVAAIKAAKFRVAIDAVNSVGGTVIPALLKALGVAEIIEINCDPTGHFAHTPEPLPENLVETSEIIKKSKVDVGFVVDPDVDRLAIINEDGSMFNEEYTLVAMADYVLRHTPGNTVSNLSSSRALRVITEKHGGSYSAAAVGEVNVVAEMRRTNAVIGGEGNGGVIYPASHNGRDALVGIALFLTHLAKTGMKCSELRKTYPDFFISKNKIELTPEIDVDQILVKMKEKYRNEQVNDIDGVKIDFAEEWVHLRKSNTEPIIRIYSEAPSMEKADLLAQKIIMEIRELAGIN